MNGKKFYTSFFILALLLTSSNTPAWASGGEEGALGGSLPFWSIIPFAGMLLSIAVIPLVNSHWWEKQMAKISAFWALVFFIPFAIAYKPEIAFSHLLEVIILDYMPFIILLFGLFAVSGGIILRGTLVGTPAANVILLAVGTLLSSVIGTTGSSMLLLRPLIRANGCRRKKAHSIIFFIFLVSNIGGSLTPIGDPPLFLGFLRGVPFFWTFNLFVPMGLNVVILLLAYYVLDRYFFKKENVLDPATNTSAIAEALNCAKEPLKVEGLHNFIYIAMIVCSVILSGTLVKNPMFADLATGALYGVPFFRHGAEVMVLPFTSILRDATILLAAILSIKTTAKVIRDDNRFTWGPIKEVAILFIGIFITMIPALLILHARGAELGLSEPMHFFWTTGILSSFLDNAPTYLVFMTTATSLGAATGVATAAGTIAAEILLAVSCGAVFMGANTYIGNAPNFMVRSIAEENSIKMPSFFGYMAWSLAFLIPLFILDTFIFFR